MKKLRKGDVDMHSIKKAIIFGILVWAVPFLASILIFQIRESNRILFESIMPVIVAGSVVIFALLYFNKASAVSVWEGFRLGLIWFVISFVIDLIMFSSGPMKMGFGDYLADVGVVYLMIPIITIGFAGSLCGRKLPE
jgi:hypothetical protein